MKQKKNIKSLDQFIEEQYGKKGIPKREKFDKGFESFKLGYMIQQARLEKGMTQEELYNFQSNSKKRRRSKSLITGTLRQAGFATY